MLSIERNGLAGNISGELHIGIQGPPGKDGSSTTISLRYGISSEPMENTVVAWQDTIPQMSETYPYLWIEINRETVTATGGSASTERGIIGYYTKPGSGGNANQGTGLTSTEKNLMLALFKAVPYKTDVSKTIKSLEAIWSGGSSGGETPDIPGVTTYTITYNLTNVTTDFIATSVTEGESITVNLTPETNAVLGEVTVMMGGVDVTATAYSNGKISISSVTGDVVITATADVASHTQVEYLESATKDAYIITPYTLKSTDLVECEWAGPPSTQWTTPFSGITNNGAMCRLNTRPDNTAGRTSYTRRGGGGFNVMNAADTDYIAPKDNTTFRRFVESIPGTGTIYDSDGNALCTLTDESVDTFPDTGCVMGLFIVILGGKNYGYAGAAGLRIKYFKIKNVYGDVVLDLIPVLDENNVACMYDKVTGEYLYDASGANGFIAGGAV